MPKKTSRSPRQFTRSLSCSPLYRGEFFRSGDDVNFSVAIHQVFQNIDYFIDSLVLVGGDFISKMAEPTRLQYFEDRMLDVIEAVQHNSKFIFSHPLGVISFLRQGASITFHNCGQAEM